MDLMLATSKAGHDNHQIYVVLKKDDQFFYLVNGTTKPMSKPKKKKKIHLQLIKNIPENVLAELKDKNELDDVLIKRILKVYNRGNDDV